MEVIHKIIASIYTRCAALEDMQNDEFLLDIDKKLHHRDKVLLINNTLQILPADQPFNPPNSDLDNPTNPNTALCDQILLNVYGTIKPKYYAQI